MKELEMTRPFLLGDLMTVTIFKEFCIFLVFFFYHCYIAYLYDFLRRIFRSTSLVVTNKDIETKHIDFQGVSFRG